MGDETQVSLKFKNSVTGMTKLEKYAEQLGVIQSALNGLDKGTMKALDTTSVTAKKTSGNVERMSNQINTAFNYTMLRTAARAFKGLGDTIRDLTESSTSFLEDFNLFQVAFDGNYKNAEKFVNKLSEMYGLDEDWLIRTTGLFKQLSNAMGLTTEQGDKLSKLMTEMSIDLSSLYNVPVEKASQVLQSSLAGQTKPIRGLAGGDITQATLQTTLDQIDFGSSVRDLSYVEKRLLIVVSLTNQLSESVGDWGRTLESPANQTRILEEQWARLSRTMGNLFLPILAKILPYLNAILMVLTEIISGIASLLGFDMSDYDFFGEATSSAYDFDDSLGAVGDSLDDVKKKMSGLRGFDKLNVITTPTATSGGSSGGGGAGTGDINPKIMDAFNKAFEEYQKKLDNVEMKATRIRDRIMEWLGFTKEIDEETGKVSFKFDHITSGTVLGSLAAGGAIYAGIKFIFDTLGRLNLTNIKLPSLGKILSDMLGISAATKTTSKFFESIKLAIQGSKIGLAPFGKLLKEWVAPAGAAVLKSLSKIALRLGGIIFIITGIVKLGNAIKNIVENGIDFKNITDALKGIALIVAGILAFSNPIAAGIALAIAGVIELVQLIVENWDTIRATVIDPVVDFITTLAQKIYDSVIKPVVDFFNPIADAIGSVFSTIFTNIAEVVTGVAKAIWSIISKIIEIQLKIIEIFAALFKAFYDYVLKPIGEAIGKAATFVYEKAIKPVLNIFAKAGEWFYKNVISPIWDKVVWVRDKIAGVFKVLGTSIADFIGGSIKAVINGVFGLIEKNINSFIKLLNSAINIINDIPGVNITKVSLLSIPRLKKGMDYVPNDFFPAYLDYGERVLTKEENREYTANKYKTKDDNKDKDKPRNNSPQVFNIYVGDEKVSSVVLDNLQDMAKANGKPITIGA